MAENLDLTTLVVDAAYADSEIGAVVGEGLVMGSNAFSSFIEAMKNIAEATTTIKINSNLEEYSEEDQSGLIVNNAVSIVADNPVTINIDYTDVSGKRRLWFTSDPGRNGTLTFGENVHVISNLNKQALFLGSISGTRFAPDIVVEGTVEAHSLWIGAWAGGKNFTVTETGRIVAKNESLIIKDGVQVTVNGTAALGAATADRVEQVYASYSQMYTGDIVLNNTLMRSSAWVELGSGYSDHDYNATLTLDNSHLYINNALWVADGIQAAPDPVVRAFFTNSSLVDIKGGYNKGEIVVDDSAVKTANPEFKNHRNIILTNGASWEGVLFSMVDDACLTIDATSSLTVGTLNISDNSRLEMIGGATVSVTKALNLGTDAAVVIDMGTVLDAGDYTLIKGFGAATSMDNVNVLNAGTAVASVNDAGDLVITIADDSRTYSGYIYTEGAASAVTNDDGTMSLKITNLDDAANRKTVKNDQAIVLEGVAADEEAQVKELTFTVDNAAAKLNFSLTSRAGRLNVQLVDAQGKVVAEQAVYNGLTRGFANQDLEQGTYTLKVAAHDKTAGGAFDFSWHLDDGVNQEQALTLDGGTSSITTEGYISTVTGSQDYTFTVASGSFDKYEISLAGMKRNLSLTILDAQQNEVYTMATGLPTKAVVSLGEGNYTMKVAQYGTSSSYTNEYELTLKKLSSKSLAMVSAADDTIEGAKSVQLGADHTDWVGTGDTIDWIKVDLGTNGYGRRALTFTGSEDYVTARLYRVAQGDATLKTALLSTISSSDGKATVRNVNFADGYDYYLRVTATSGRNVEAGYTLNIASA